MFTQTEHWVAVPGFAGLYEVSSHGRVKSLSRRIRNGPDDGNHFMWTKERILAASVDSHGYRYVALPRLAPDGSTTCKYRNCRVHLLVLLAFVGPVPTGQMGRHKDNDRTNNCVGNLEYGTARDNMHDKFRHGTNPAGSRNPGSKLTEDLVLGIRREFVSGARQQDLAAKYGVSAATVCNVIRGKAWRHVEMPSDLIEKLSSIKDVEGKSCYNSTCKLVKGQVLEIRRLHSCGDRSLRSLAVEYGVSVGAVFDIVRRKNWRHISE